MPLLAGVLFFGTVGVAQAAGWWVTNGRDVGVGPALTPADVKGWMMLQDVSDGLGLPVDQLVVLTGAGPDDGVDDRTALKDLEALVPGFDLATFRTALDVLLADSATGAGAAATPMAGASGPPTPTDAPAGAAPDGATGLPSGTPTGTPDSQVRGSMTLLEVAEQTGIEVADLIAASGLPTDTDPSTTLRDLRDLVPGFELQTVRDAVATLTGD
jgi:hypothetical protein